MDAKEQMIRSIKDLLILACLNEEASFSYYISKRIQERSQGLIHIPSGCIIPHLLHMLEEGYIQETAREINGKICDCFEITPAGNFRMGELSNAYLVTHQALLTFFENEKE